MPSAAGAADPLRAQQWGLDMVEADAAHAIATGRGAIVAIVDTGVLASHEDLQGRLLPSRDFVDDDDTPEDGDGHGTHVAGVVVASKDNGVGISSVAPGASALPVRALDDTGSGTAEDVADGIDYAVDRGAHVINLSLGGEVPGAEVIFNSREVDQALDRALARNVVIVAAAGNNAVPLCEQRFDVLCVGAVGQARERAVYSNFAGEEGLMAPGGNSPAGRDIISTIPYVGFDKRKPSNSAYGELGGTSQASPHVAGVAALLVEKGLRGPAVARRIRLTATDAGLAGRDVEYGHGIVNARAAVAGLSPPGPGGGTATVTVARSQRFRSVLKKGIKIRCQATAAGRCTATVRRGARVFASGSRRVVAGRTFTLLARPTGAARREIKRASRRGRKIRLTLEVTVPGAPTQLRRTTLRR